MKPLFEEGTLVGAGSPRFPAEITTLDRAALRKVVRGTFWLTLGAGVLLVVLKVLAIFEIGTLWDDAYIVQRYAHNLLHDGVVAWNPGEAPSYGVTSPAFLLVATPLQLLAGGNWALSAALSSALGGVLFLAALGLALLRSGAPPRARAAALALTVFCIATSPTTDHFASGMDTTLALAWMAASLLAALRFEASPSRARAAALGGAAGLCLVFRPDMLLIVGLVPPAFVLLARERAERRSGLLALGVMVAVLASLLLAGSLYFGTALPLPAHAKRPGFYGAGFDAIYRGRALDALLAFVASYWPLFLAVAAGLVAGGRKTSSRAPLDTALVLGGLVFMAYHLFATLPIMPMSQRFFQPLVPVLGLLTARCFGRLGEWSPLRREAWEPRHVAFAAVALGLALFSSLAPQLTTAGRALGGAVSAGRAFSFDLERMARSGPFVKNWHKVASLRSLPDDLTLAATEIGGLGAVLPNKRITDLAGLTDPEFALARFDPERLFARGKPDVIYMPHPDYREMIRALLDAPEMAEYEVYSKEALGTYAFGVAILKSSPHYARLHALMPRPKTDEAAAVQVGPTTARVAPRVR